MSVQYRNYRITPDNTGPESDSSFFPPVPQLFELGPPWAFAINCSQRLFEPHWKANINFKSKEKRGKLPEKRDLFGSLWSPHHTNASTQSPVVHGSTKSPLVLLLVVHFNGLQVSSAVKATDSIQLAIDNC